MKLLLTAALLLATTTTALADNSASCALRQNAVAIALEARRSGIYAPLKAVDLVQSDKRTKSLDPAITVMVVQQVYAIVFPHSKWAHKKLYETVC